MYDDFEKVCKPLNSINPDFPFTLTKRTDACKAADRHQPEDRIMHILQ
ncbi:MAG: hypothetical protein MZV63_43300 [Marinilabiliales bacterium]|nr:hypothetical protein [Marinilabiliales bacterium]